ncbi:MAG: S1C family serine protease [Planctomycetota bacterium]|jgi:S1-C subfamily serine protease
MIRHGLLLLVAAAALAGGPPIRSPKIDLAVRKIQPSVVKVWGAKGFRGIYGFMTGVIVHKSGLVVTRRSVTIEESDRIRCHLHDGRRLTARIVREDRKSKMVILKLEGDPGSTYPVAQLAPPGTVKPGQFVLLVGNAYNVAMADERCAVNFGVVSAVTRLRMRSRMFAFEYPGKVILHDAMNNPGVYGGPLVNLDGEVIGISGTLVESAETNAQVHYAIPIEDLMDFIADTIKNPSAARTYDRGGTDEPGGKDTDRPLGWHGIRLLKSGINRATPAYVDRVMRDSPAHKAGLRADDLILKVDETRIKSWKTFSRTMKTYRAGDTAKLTIRRGNDIKLLILELTARPKR